MFTRIPATCLKNPKVSVTTWLMLALLSGLLGIIIGTRTVIPGPSNIDALLQNPAEQKAIQAGIPPLDTLLIVLGHPKLEHTAPEFILARDRLVTDLLAMRSSADQTLALSRVETVGHTFLNDDVFAAKDPHFILLKGTTIGSIDQAGVNLAGLPELVAKWQKAFPGFTLSYLSDGTVNSEIFQLIDRDLDSSLIYTLPITFLVLFWAFGSLISACVPLVIAGISLICSLGISAVASHLVAPVSATAAQLVVLLVLAIGIDYSLFIISRIREEVSGGLTFEVAVLKALETTGMAVFWSGAVVALSLCGLFLMEDTVLASMAFVSIISVIVTVLSALLALPSILLLLGPLRICGKSAKMRQETSRPRFSLVGLWLRLSTQRPLPVLLLSSGLLIFVGYFSSFMILGSTVEPHTLPHSMQSHTAFKELENKFPDLAGTDFSIIFSGTNLSEIEEEGELQPFFDILTDWASVRGPLRIDRSEDGQVLRYQYIALGSGNEEINKDLIHQLRNKYIPELLEPFGVSAGIGGTLPYVVDDIDRYWSRTPLVFATVMGLSLIFLLIAFRSLVVPLKAMLLNILSTLAAFGMLVIVFQISEFDSFNFHVIESFIPPLLFSILFGLSMDYHVFLIARVYEEYTHGSDTKTAVICGIERTYKTITSAALIMVSVFMIIASLELPIMKELGLGLAIAVAIDATIIRCLLLPASMVLLGDWNWYLPRFLQWLPRLRFE